MTIIEFLAACYHPNPIGQVKIKDAHLAYLATLPERERRLCPRWKFADEVSRHLPVGRDSDKVLSIGGISSQPPNAWTVTEDGRLRLQQT
ncbi:hypothetical protein DTL42_19350 [Bremerella cremea]|uniref:Uncharacterized protein n=1 Tax=Bremerella cremea TaxID=1031537 RepID=A0A368KPE7_9BACT|nr:hypothetical protein [Bremerella cremea]RCS42296.1 hypothetical protein DTL42_19350 [Bremerella cremea]